MSPTRPIDGLLVVDKPPQWTSHDVVARVRRITGTRRIGHTGTLDPMATGVLVLCLGRATRLAEYVTGQPKTYLAEITLGTATDTYDAEGTTVFTGEVPSLDFAAVDQALDAFRGTFLQFPPVYSALKREGQPLYKRARRGEAVETEARPVHVYDLKLLAYADGALQALVRCSAGTYVRSIAHDLGQTLGCGAHLSGLRRTAVGRFRIEEAVTIEALEARGYGWQDLLLPMDDAVRHLPIVTVPEAQARGLLHGQSIPEPLATVADPHDRAQLFRAVDAAGRLLAIVRFDDLQNAWRPLKVLADPAAVD